MNHLKNKCDFYLEKIAVHDHAVLRYLYTITGDAALAEDLKQSTMEKAWKGLSDLREVRKAKSWLMSIAKNEAKQYYRKNSQKSYFKSDNESSEDMDLLKDTDPLVEEILIKEFEISIVTKALERLDQKYQRLLRMYYIERISAKEIAEILNINYSTTRVNLTRGLTKLREIYDMLEKGQEK